MRFNECERGKIDRFISIRFERNEKKKKKNAVVLLLIRNTGSESGETSKFLRVGSTTSASYKFRRKKSSP